MNKKPSKITVPLEHLHPVVQQHLVGPKLSPKNIHLAEMRSDRVMTELMAALGVGINLTPPEVPLLDLTGIGLIGGSLAFLRPLVVKSIQLKHELIADAIKQHGVLGDVEGKTRQKYGDNLKVSKLVKTNPIFYVKGNGDLVFVKNSRAEYYRYKAQEALPGKIGVHPWRWRAYLQLPTAPETVKVWAKKKVGQLVEKITPDSLPAPARVKIK